MQAFTEITGLVAPLEVLNVDTDQIIPKQFLKRIEKTGYGQYLFFDWRFHLDGTMNPDLELNASRYKGAAILLAKDNFGCGSSREHAPWALEDYGIRCILAPSFADIFYNNCFNNGMLPIALKGEIVAELFHEVRDQEGYELNVNLSRQLIIKPDGRTIPFEVDPFNKRCLLEGLDQIGLSLAYIDKITAYERERGIG
ncbi:MAG: 3-isopropylmalate dehydratase small subunit [Candidatus Marinimicrobia bacterium]|nr:3-isopropylmalate dehydratase small subunit [Candidatus Neomarinimicrobiota bacterium]